jgi:hypothetical protein
MLTGITVLPIEAPEKVEIYLPGCEAKSELSREPEAELLREIARFNQDAAGWAEAGARLQAEVGDLHDHALGGEGMDGPVLLARAQGLKPLFIDHVREALALLGRRIPLLRGISKYYEAAVAEIQEFMPEVERQVAQDLAAAGADTSLPGFKAQIQQSVPMRAIRLELGAAKANLDAARSRARDGSQELERSRGEAARALTVLLGV